VSAVEASTSRHDPVVDRRVAERLLLGHMQGRRWVTGERWTLTVEPEAFVLTMERPDE